jgi:hypothetical protein
MKETFSASTAATHKSQSANPLNAVFIPVSWAEF